MLLLLLVLTKLFILVYHYNHLSYPPPSVHYHQVFKMATLSSIQETHDPKAPLSGEDLLSLLMEYCNDRIRDNAKSEREFTRELTNDKIDIVVKGFGDGIATVANSFNEDITNQKTNAAELELKLDTKVTYLEQLLQTLGKNLETVTRAFNKHIKVCHLGSSNP